MKTYNIELPAEFRSGNSIPVERATITRDRMTEILQDAVEAALQSQSMDAEHWAELHRLRAKRRSSDREQKMWKAAAISERVMRVAAEKALKSQDRADAVERLIEAVRNYMSFGCPVCSGDCFSANPPVSACPVREAQEAIDHALRIEGEGK